MISTLLNRPCTVTRRTESGTVDAYGDEVATVQSVETVCELQRHTLQNAEQAEAEVSDTTWDLYLPSGTVIDTDDIVTVDGEDYEMVGDPWHVRNPRTQQESHVQANVRRTAGAWVGS